MGKAVGLLGSAGLPAGANAALVVVPDGAGRVAEGPTVGSAVELRPVCVSLQLSRFTVVALSYWMRSK